MPVGLLSAAVTWCLAQPPVRAFLEDLFLRIFSDMFFRTDSDPAFKSAFMTLSEKLAAEPTEEGKRAILKQIKALRGNG
jgi:hypothetical protein